MTLRIHLGLFLPSMLDYWEVWSHCYISNLWASKWHRTIQRTC